MTTPSVGETEALRRCLRDVLSLLALPASWRGRAPEQILLNFSEALEASIEVDVIVASVRSVEATTTLVRIDGASCPAREAEVSGRFAAMASKSASTIATVDGGPLGELTAVYEPIGYYASLGYMILACRRRGFPSANELPVIRAAVALATTAVETSRAMREREEALRAKDDFLAVLGHELRNPLAPITTALEIMRQRTRGQVTREEQLIERQVDHLSRLVDDLLDVARIARGTIELKRCHLELATVVEQAVEATASLVEERQHSLRVDVPKTGLAIFGDRFRLMQILVNLLTNAARYTPEGGHIELTATASDPPGRARIAVRDNGIGMTAEFLPRIFEPFVQARRATDAKYRGLGVGLALVRTLVDLHGGTVSATSSGLGCGSQLLVELPLVPHALVPVGPDTPPERQQIRKMTSRRILVVDDNADAGELLAVALRMAGHQVEVLDDPYCVADATERFRPETVVLDLGMPGLDGYAVAAHIQERLGEHAPPLIALTGYGQPDDRHRTRASGFAAHHVKPVQVADLVGTIAELCDARPARPARPTPATDERPAASYTQEPNPARLIPSMRTEDVDGRKGASE